MDQKQQLMTDLLNNYAGDDAWQHYVSTFEKDWHERNDKELFLSYFQDRELAIVLSVYFDVGAIEWFERNDIPALKGAGSPKDLLSASAGITCLRSLLMRLP